MAAVALRMPSHYVPVEAEEMEYVEGGKWSGETLFSNLVTIGSYVSWLTIPVIQYYASCSYLFLTANCSAFFAKIGSLGGPVLAVLGVLAGAALIYALGTITLPPI